MKRMAQWWYGTESNPLTYSQAIARAGLIFLMTFLGVGGLVYFTLFSWLWP